MTSEARLEELARMLANHPFLVLAVDEINSLEEEAAELRVMLRKCLEYFVDESEFMRDNYSELIPGVALVEEILAGEIRAVLSPQAEPAKLETRSEEEK